MDDEKTLKWANAHPYDLSDLSFRYTMYSYEEAMKPKDYGTGEKYSLTEVHTVTHIEEHPGITVTQMAEELGRTKSAISQIITKLEKKKLVYRAYGKEDGKKVFLSVTPSGRELSIAHKQYDIKNVIEFQNELRKHFSEEELDTFYRVMEMHLIIEEEGLL